jgi:hypothetical protein
MRRATLRAGRRCEAQTALREPSGQLSAAVLEQAHVVADQLVVAFEHQFAVVMLLEAAIEQEFKAHRPVGAGPDSGNAAADQWKIPVADPNMGVRAVTRAAAASRTATNHLGAAWGRRGV